MPRGNIRFYGSVVVVWLIGVLLLWNGNRGGFYTEEGALQPGQCVFKAVSGIPCPGCGTTRSILAIADGQLLDGLWWNPVGYLVGGVILILPAWTFTDLLIRRATLMRGYQKLETHLKKPAVYLPVVLLIIVNWIWNIMKGL